MNKNIDDRWGICLSECEENLVQSINVNQVESVIQKRGVATDAGSRRGCI